MLRRRILGSDNQSETDLVITYNFNEANVEKQLMSSNSSYGINKVDSMEIDGVKQSRVVWKYKFSTAGEHTVKYKLKDNTTIGYCMFYLSSGLNYGYSGEGIISVYIPSSVLKIDYGAFMGGLNLSRVNSDDVNICNIPNSVTEICHRAFEDCRSFISVIIPESMQSIGDYIYGDGHPFANCSNLQYITVDENNSVYDSRNNCNAIIETSTNILKYGCCGTVIPNNVVAIGPRAFENISIYSITIPSNVLSIGDNAFVYSGLYTINSETDGIMNIPEGVEDIEFEAFYGCSQSQIFIPSSVNYIGFNPWCNCYWGNYNQTIGIVVDSNNSVYDSRNNCNAIIETSTNSLVVGCMTTVIPNGIVRIKESAFHGIGNGRTAFSLTVPNTVTYIESYAFSQFSTDYGNEAVSLTFLSTTPPTLANSTCFMNFPSRIPVYVPSASVTAYQTATYWSNIASQIEAIP